MPEGPECRILCDWLQKYVGKEMVALTILSGKYHRKPFNNFEHLEDLLPIPLTEINVKGKFFWFETDDKDVTFWNGLGMTGWWKDEEDKHARLMIEFDDGSILYYSDQRNFGNFHLSFDRDELEKKLKTIGPDLLTGDVPYDVFSSRLQKKNWAICKALMDQSVLSGVGNYLKAEILYRARLSPFRQISDISDEEMNRLYLSTMAVMTESYSSCGIDGGPLPPGDTYRVARKLVLRVYNRSKCSGGHTVQTDKTPDGRTTHWVPEIQH